MLACGARSRSDSATGTVNGNDSAVARPAMTEVEFARDTVERLLNGDPTVEEAFEWENLKVPGAADAGEAYSELPDDENRPEFRKGFIEKFSESFKSSGASVADLKNWREQSRNGETIIVAADTTGGKPLFVTVVRRDKRQKISEISIK